MPRRLEQSVYYLEPSRLKLHKKEHADCRLILLFIEVLCPLISRLNLHIQIQSLDFGVAPFVYMMALAPLP